MSFTNSLPQEITVLQEISSAVVHQKDVTALLYGILDVLNRRMGMLRGTFTLLRGDTLVIEASHGLDAAERELGRYRIGEGITGHVAETGKSHVVPDIRNDNRFLNRTKSRNYNRQVAFICVPIIFLEKVIGTLSIDRLITPETNLENDTALLEIIGNLTADAVGVRQKELEEHQKLLEENKKLRAMLTADTGGFIGNSSAMQQVTAQIRQVAPSNAIVMIRGASGTGKELAARAIVNLSPRKACPFATLNCAAMPADLVENEIFGYEKNAFAGATSRRNGLLEKLDGGTVFLDEIGELSMQAQIKLLRFIQEGEFTRAGSITPVKADVRLMVATSHDLELLMRQGIFRQDLYYRLTVFPIVLPPLTQRKSDIILLAEHFIEKLNLKYNKTITRLSTPAINMLMSYHWPGNVRELENCMERAVLTATDGCIHGYNLPPSLQTGKENGTELLPEGKASLNTLVDSYERELIVESLKKYGGNMSAAARALGLSPRVIHYKIHKLGITPEWYTANSEE